MASALSEDIAEVELGLLLDALRRAFDRDFADFSHAVLRRRVNERMRAERTSTISALQDRVLHDPVARDHLLVALGGGKRALFHQPEFFQTFRGHIIPLLQTYPFVRIWLPGVGSGEDAYAIAALLYDAGMLDRSLIYATAFAPEAIAQARQGEYAVASRSGLSASITAAGIETPIDDLLTIRSGRAIFRDEIREKVMFAQHAVARSVSINEFHAIIARGTVPIYTLEAQYRIHRIFYESLARLGFLCLGVGENIAGSVHEAAYRRVVEGYPVYRRMH